MTSTTQDLLEQTMQQNAPAPELHTEVDGKIQAFLKANPAKQTSKGLWICPGTVSLEHDGWDLKVSGRFLYPPDSPWNHVELSGKVSGITIGSMLPTVGVATMYLGADDLVGSVDLSVNGGGVGPGGVHLGFMRRGQDVGFFAAGAAIEGLIIATGTGTFKRVD